jgi:hypothetical protein
MYIVILTSLTKIVCVSFHRKRPSLCRANDFNKSYLCDRYVNFIQDLTAVPGVIDALHRLAEQDARIKFVKGFLRLKPGLFSHVDRRPGWLPTYYYHLCTSYDCRLRFDGERRQRSEEYDMQSGRSGRAGSEWRIQVPQHQARCRLLYSQSRIQRQGGEVHSLQVLPQQRRVSVVHFYHSGRNGARCVQHTYIHTYAHIYIHKVYISLL